MINVQQWESDKSMTPVIANSLETDACPHCTPREPLRFGFSMAFQPIVDMRDFTVFAHEALVRGTAGEGAGSVLSQVDEDNRYRFDQACRRKAIGLAASIGMQSSLSINFLPNAVYEPANCLRATLQAARKHQFPVNRIIFEITENERVIDHDHLINIISEYRRQGFRTAIDDFGAGYSGLNLLADFQPDLVKLDMALVRDIHRNAKRQTILTSIVAMCEQLDIEVIAEGIENEDELACIEDHGIHLVQGFLLARPGFEKLPDWTVPFGARVAAS